MIVPVGRTWDCHAHVIGDPAQYPLAPGRSYDPPLAPLEAYLSFLGGHGIARGLLVQPSVYGFDNRCMLDALDRANGRLVGVAVPSPDSTPRDLEALHLRGVRGVRCNRLNPGGLAPDVVLRWRPQLREMGWHVALHMAVGDTSGLRAYLERFELPVAIDHMGRPDLAPVGVAPLEGCVRDNLCFVKLSAPYRISSQPAPWRDVTVTARSLLAANPAGCLWGSDWPHTDVTTPVRAVDLFAALDEWCGDPGTRRVVMTDAPTALLGDLAA